MGILKYLDGYASTLTEALDSDDGATLSLCDADYLFKEMQVGDYTYLMLGDGVSVDTVKVTRQAMSFTVEHMGTPRIWPSGAKIYFGTNQYMMEDMVETAVADKVGATIMDIKTDGNLSVDVVNRVATIRYTGSTGGEAVDFCNLATGTATHYIGCDGDGALIRAAKPIITSGGASVSGGEGISVSDTGVVSLEPIHGGYTTNVTAVDEYGRVTDADNASSGGGSTSPFSEDITWPSGEFNPSFTVTNGMVVAVDKASGGSTESGGYAAGDGLTERASGSDTVFELEEITGGEVSEDNLTFNKYGQLVAVEKKTDVVQRYAKQPFTARMEVNLVHGQNDGYEVINAFNLNVEEVQRFSDQVDYQFTFDTPAPDNEYVVVAAAWGRMPSKITKTTGGFLLRIAGYSVAGWMPLSIIVQGALVDPVEATVYGYNPAEKP